MRRFVSAQTRCSVVYCQQTDAVEQQRILLYYNIIINIITN